MGFMDWMFGTDPEKYVADPRASTMGGPRHDYDVSAERSTAANAGSFNLGYADATRGRQMGLADSLTAAAAGRGPSGAQMAATAQRENALLDAAALQSGRRGTSAAAGIGVAQRAATMGGQQAAQTEAIGRAQEMAQARGELGGVLSGLRGQDIGVAGQMLGARQFNAGLQQQTNLANQAAGNQMALANQAAALGISTQELQARLEQERIRAGNLDPGSGGMFGSLLGAGATLGAAAISDERSKTAVVDYDGHRMRVPAMAGGGLVTGYPYGPAGGIGYRPPGRRARSEETLGAALNFLAQAYLAKSMGKDAKKEKERKDAEAKAKELQARKDLYAEQSMTPEEFKAYRKRQLDELIAGEKPMPGEAPKGSPSGQYQPYDYFKKRPNTPPADPGGAPIELGPDGQPLFPGSVPFVPAPAPPPPTPDELGIGPGQIPRFARGGLVAGPTLALVGEAGPELVVPLSDRRKTAEARDMLDELEPKTYEYNDRAQAAGATPGRHAGVMWQDLMRSKMGRTMDGGVDPETGYHTVDYASPMGLSALMASVADLNQRLGRVEGKKKGGR